MGHLGWSLRNLAKYCSNGKPLLKPSRTWDTVGAGFDLTGLSLVGCSLRVLRLEAVVFDLNLGAAVACEVELFALFPDTATVRVGFILATDTGT